MQRLRDQMQVPRANLVSYVESAAGVGQVRAVRYVLVGIIQCMAILVRQGVKRASLAGGIGSLILEAPGFTVQV